MTIRRLCHALDASGLPAHAFGSTGGGRSGKDETPPTDPKQGTARQA